MDIHSFLNIKHHEERPPRGGDLLIANPLLQETFFTRAVILLIAHDSNKGMFGLAINMETNLMLSDLLPDWDKDHDMQVYCGGPCDTDRLFMLHSLGAEVMPGSVAVCPGIWLCSNIDALRKYADEGGDYQDKVKFMAGYSGWARGQLGSELEAGTWAVRYSVDTSRLLRGAGLPFWRTQVELLGPAYRSWLLVPSRPEFN